MWVTNVGDTATRGGTDNDSPFLPTEMARQRHRNNESEEERETKHKEVTYRNNER